jgi:hypothetical protein
MYIYDKNIESFLFQKMSAINYIKCFYEQPSSVKYSIV